MTVEERKESLDRKVKAAEKADKAVEDKLVELVKENEKLQKKNQKLTLEREKYKEKALNPTRTVVDQNKERRRLTGMLRKMNSDRFHRRMYSAFVSSFSSGQNICCWSFIVFTRNSCQPMYANRAFMLASIEFMLLAA